MDAGFERMREQDVNEATGQAEKLTRRPISDLRVSSPIPQSLSENFNLLLSRISDIENRLLALERRIISMERENKLRHIHEGFIFLGGINGVGESEKQAFLVRLLNETAQILRDGEDDIVIS